MPSDRSFLLPALLLLTITSLQQDTKEGKSSTAKINVIATATGEFQIEHCLLFEPISFLNQQNNKGMHKFLFSYQPY